MSVFTLVISCLDHVQLILIHGPNISNSYAIFFLQHQTLLSPSDTSMAEHCFHLGPAISFFLEIAFHSSSVAYWTSSNCETHFPSSHHCLFIRSMGFSRQEWSGLPFCPPMDHILSEHFTMTHLSSVALYGMNHSFTELHKSFCTTRL